MMSNRSLRCTRFYAKKVLRKAPPPQHFAVGLAKTTAGSTFIDLAVHHHVPDLVMTLTDASVLQVVSTVALIVKEL